MGQHLHQPPLSVRHTSAGGLLKLDEETGGDGPSPQSILQIIQNHTGFRVNGHFQHLQPVALQYHGYPEVTWRFDRHRVALLVRVVRQNDNASMQPWVVMISSGATPLPS